MEQEKRVNPRFEIEVPVTLRTKGKLIPAATLDISSGGISVLADFNEDLNEGPVEVIMDLSDELRDISLRGHILRLKKGIGQKVAIQFVPTDSQSLRSLERFLRNRLH